MAASGCVSNPRHGEADRPQGASTAAGSQESGAFSRYVESRLRDFGDVFTLGVERNVYGFSLWLGCLGGGLQRAQAGRGVGLRGGSLGSYRTGAAETVEPYFRTRTGDSWLLVNSRAHRPLRGDSRGDAKAYSHANVLFARVLLDRTGLRSLGQLELSVGLFGGIRVGVDLFELLDLALGVLTIDFMQDDVRPPPAR